MPGGLRIKDIDRHALDSLATEAKIASVVDWLNAHPETPKLEGG
jgi:hypothetical protein